MNSERDLLNKCPIRVLLQEAGESSGKELNPDFNSLGSRVIILKLKIVMDIT